MEAVSVRGNLFIIWGYPTKQKIASDSSTNMTLSNEDIHIYNLHLNYDKINQSPVYTDETWENA